MALLEMNNEDSPSAKQSFELVNLKRRLHELLKKDEKLSNTNSFGFAVLSSVVQGNYERARAELEAVHLGLEEYSDFEKQARRFIEHAKSLVTAIKVKYELCSSEQVGKTKEKELANMVIEHFTDLRKSIIAIERIQKNVRSADLRSTTELLKILFFSVVAVFAVYSYYYEFPIYYDLANSKIFSFFTWRAPN